MTFEKCGAIADSISLCLGKPEEVKIWNGKVGTRVEMTFSDGVGIYVVVVPSKSANEKSDP